VCTSEVAVRTGESKKRPLQSELLRVARRENASFTGRGSCHKEKFKRGGDGVG